MDRKVALITGVTGQDGSYLSEFLLEKGYDVHGMVRIFPNSFSKKAMTYTASSAAARWTTARG